MLGFMKTCECVGQIDKNIEQTLKKHETEAIIFYQRCSSDESNQSSVNGQENDVGNLSCNCTVSPYSKCSTDSKESSKLANFSENETIIEREEETEKKSNGVELCPSKKQLEQGIDKADCDVECTLAMIKPEAVISRKEIERRIDKEGFSILQTRWLQLTPEQASEFYKDVYGRPDFPCLVAHIASASVIVMILAKNRAIDHWKELIGPEKVSDARMHFPQSLRAKYGRDDLKNALHGSETPEKAEREIHFFFPDFIIEPLLTEKKSEEYLWMEINAVLARGLIQCCESKPADPIKWLANWLIMNNPNKPKLPQSLTLILT